MKILFMAPYKGMKELAESISSEYEKEVKIDIYEGNYEKGPKIIKELIKSKRDYSVVITRGGTVKACSKVIDIPIIDININAFDIIRSLKLCEGYTGKKIFLAYPSLVHSFETLSNLLGYDINSKSYDKYEDVKDIIENLKNEDYDLVIGDNIVYKTAQEYGLNSILFTSGAESIRSAIEEGVRLTKALNQGKKVLEVEEECTYEMREKLNVYDSIKIYEENEISPSLVQTVFPNNILVKIQEFSNTSIPTIITGPDGMCKNDAGYLCCAYGSKKRKKLLCVSCYTIGEDYNYEYLNNIIKEQLWNNGGTVFFEDIDTLPKEGQKELIKILKIILKNTDIKVIASSETSIEIAVENKIILKHIRSIIDEVRIELEPLKKYSDEINNMVSIYLGKLGARCGSSIVGINNPGIKMLKNYDWPGNLKQFMRVINQLVLECDGPYISANSIKDILRKEQVNWKHKKLVPIDLSGSLKEIETNIINHIMIEEGMNQKKVEKRLGISHSTLWRKLK